MTLVEGRRLSCDEHGGPHQVLLRVSSDAGRTWGQHAVLVSDQSFRDFGPQDSFRNPTPVVHRGAGLGAESLVVLFNRIPGHLNSVHQALQRADARETWVIRGSLVGDTGHMEWSVPVNATANVQHEHGTLFAVSNSVGVEVELNSPPGGMRLIVSAEEGTLSNLHFACDSQRATCRSTWHGLLLLSDDGGRSWRRGARLPAGTREVRLGAARGRMGVIGAGWTEHGRPEGQVVVASLRTLWPCEGHALEDLLFWVQVQKEQPPTHCRAMAWSYDGGDSLVALRDTPHHFHKGHYQDSPLDSGIGAALLATNAGRILIAAQVLSTSKDYPLTLSVSRDAGLNWSAPLSIWPHTAGPVSIARAAGDALVAVFEGSPRGIQCNHPFEEAVGACGIVEVRVRERDAVLR